MTSTDDEAALTEERGKELQKGFAITVKGREGPKRVIFRCGPCITIVFLLCLVLTPLGLLRSRRRVTDDCEMNDRAYAISVSTIDEAQGMVEVVRRETAIMSDAIRKNATEYVNDVQSMLKKRVEKRVKTISELVQNKVQDIENQLAVFEKAISTAVDGNLDFTKKNIATIKTSLETASNASALADAIDRVEKEIAQFATDLEQMYLWYGPYIDNILHHKVENITNRIRMMLVADRKLFTNMAKSRVAFCYTLARQNYDISRPLETVLDVINSLRDAANCIRFSQDAGAKNALAAALKDTEQTFRDMMNTDAYFLGTVLKELAYEKHLEMKDFVKGGYETAIRSLQPAIEKTSRSFQVVKEAHWRQITNALTFVLADVSTLVQKKASLIADDNLRKRVKNSELDSMYRLVENKFKNILAKVNPAFETKQGQMFEGLGMALDFTIGEQLPLIATWSLLNYLPAGACPMSIDFQTYLKGTMDRYLSQSTNLNVVPGLLNEALELDANFDSIKRDPVEDESGQKRGE